MVRPAHYPNFSEQLFPESGCGALEGSKVATPTKTRIRAAAATGMRAIEQPLGPLPSCASSYCTIAYCRWVALKAWGAMLIAGRALAHRAFE